METPGSLANSLRAGGDADSAFVCSGPCRSPKTTPGTPRRRGAREETCIAAEQEDLAAILISMEEAEDRGRARINARQSVMHTVNRTLEEFITSVEMKLRGGGEGEDTKRVLATNLLGGTLRKRELPTLSRGVAADSFDRVSIATEWPVSADSPTTSGSRWSTRSPSFRRRRCSS